MSFTKPTRMPKFVLVLMIRNEEKILLRCLEAAAAIADAFCICDTGSTDASCEIATEFLKTHDGCLTHEPWKDFGYNRTVSFRNAQSYLSKTGWDLPNTYGLLLDADMVFVQGSLKTQPLDHEGYTIIQKAGALEYPNTRLVRMDYAWSCRGVTHEYWDGPTKALPTSVCFIDDRNDGGCKSDKFERDLRLLEQGLIDEPTNGRYMFYLAQTYNGVGKLKECIAMYKKRIAIGGWEEELWYSHYMIGKSWLALKNIPKFEQWMLMAYARRPTRAEPIYQLAKYFRENSQHHKAYHYTQVGLGIPLSDDMLFVETDVYTGLFEYEATILLYYIGQNARGLDTSIKYMLSDRPHRDNVYGNLPFYIKALDYPSKAHPIPRDVFGEDYHPTSVSVFVHEGKVVHNVRFVNYVIQPQTGSYLMKEDGVVRDNSTVRTQNAFYNPATGEFVKMRDESVQLARKPGAHIVGLEDVRVYRSKNGTLCCTATTWEYTDKIRIFQATYNPVQGLYSDCRILDSPGNQECEKNWLAIDGTDHIIYGWNPLRVGTIHNTELVIHTEHKTPWYFTHFRGSAVAFQPPQYPGETWALVHTVEYCQPRKYFHLFVRLGADFKPKMISRPFVFRAKTIEYCIGCVPDPAFTTLTCVFSTMDDNPRIMEIPVEDLDWIQT
jgi:glycosyltransferase involved in cell wall biosynthesis